VPNVEYDFSDYADGVYGGNDYGGGDYDYDYDDSDYAAPNDEPAPTPEPEQEQEQEPEPVPEPVQVVVVTIEVPATMTLVLDVIPEPASAEMKVLVTGLTSALEDTVRQSQPGATVEVLSVGGVGVGRRALAGCEDDDALVNTATSGAYASCAAAIEGTAAAGIELCVDDTTLVQASVLSYEGQFQEVCCASCGGGVESGAEGGGVDVDFIVVLPWAEDNDTADITSMQTELGTAMEESTGEGGGFAAALAAKVEEAKVELVDSGEITAAEAAAVSMEIEVEVVVMEDAVVVEETVWVMPEGAEVSDLCLVANTCDQCLDFACQWTTKGGCKGKGDWPGTVTSCSSGGDDYDYGGDDYASDYGDNFLLGGDASAAGVAWATLLLAALVAALV
jgi:hypothetical protein